MTQTTGALCFLLSCGPLPRQKFAPSLKNYHGKKKSKCWCSSFQPPAAPPGTFQSPCGHLVSWLHAPHPKSALKGHVGDALK